MAEPPWSTRFNHGQWQQLMRGGPDIKTLSIYWALNIESLGICRSSCLLIKEFGCVRWPSLWSWLPLPSRKSGSLQVIRSLSSGAAPFQLISVGSSSGFGRRLALAALARGDLVIVTARTLSKVDDFPKSSRLHLIQLDVCDGEEIIKRKLEEAPQVWGRIDVCVNNAGIGLKGFIEESGWAQLASFWMIFWCLDILYRSKRFKEQFQTNVFGLMDVTNAVLPHMREQRSGTIVLIGSRSSWRPENPVCVSLKLLRDHVDGYFL